MSVADLITRPAELLSRDSDLSPDADGVQTWDETVTATFAELQLEASFESNGNMTESALYRLFLRPEVEPRGWDALRLLEAPERVYELEGDAWLARNPRTGEPSHVEARVRRVE